MAGTARFVRFDGTAGTSTIYPLIDSLKLASSSIVIQWTVGNKVTVCKVY